MKIRFIKLANSIRIGTAEKPFLMSEDYDMELSDGIRIRITEKKPRAGKPAATSYTSLMNCIYWVLLEDEVKPEPVKPEPAKNESPAPARRSRRPTPSA